MNGRRHMQGKTCTINQQGSNTVLGNLWSRICSNHNWSVCPYQKSLCEKFLKENYEFHDSSERCLYIFFFCSYHYYFDVDIHKGVLQTWGLPVISKTNLKVSCSHTLICSESQGRQRSPQKQKWLLKKVFILINFDLSNLLTAECVQVPGL